MDLSNFSTKDFLLNESFQRWVLESDEVAKCFWEECLAAYPEKYEMISDARTHIETMHGYFAGLRKEDETEVWQRISNSIEEVDLETMKDNIHRIS
jgi:transmembrane sensor